MIAHTGPAPALVDGGTEFDDQFVCSFGKDAAVGCFVAESSVSVHRRDRVLLETPRGLEVGEVLNAATVRQARLLGGQIRGRLIRSLNKDDDATIASMEMLAANVLSVGERMMHERLIDVPLLDAEVFFDLHSALVHILHPNPDDLAPLAEMLSTRTGLSIRFANLALPADPHGCGEPNCGGGQCDSCSTGGCATGCGAHSKSPPDLRPYFAHLREGMEASQRIRLV
jgi:hypothetical protein